jgi:hypothetical protein
MSRILPTPLSRLISNGCAALLLLSTAGCDRSGDWNETFHRSEGWWYSDGGGSVELPDGRTVWLFGDTWIRDNPNLLFNSMALQDTEPGRAPRKDEIRFFARGEQGALVDVTTLGTHATRSWVEPSPEGRGSGAQPGRTPQHEHSSTWLWPTAALAAGGTLIATYTEVGCLHGAFPACRSSLANMDIVGHQIVEVENPTEEPDRWKIRTTELRDRGGSGPPAHRLHWGSALLEEGGWLYVFGATLTAQSAPEDVTLARVAPRDVARYAAWQFLTPGGWQMVPTGPTPADLQSLAPGGATELSVHRVERDGQSRIVLLQVDSFTQEIVVRSAAAGPLESVRWGSPKEAAGVRRFSLPVLDPKTAGGMSWAGRAHPQHSSRDELLVSYFSERAHSLRFIELPLSKAVGPP